MFSFHSFLIINVFTNQALLPYAKMESLSVKTHNSQDTSTELQLQKEGDVLCFDDIVAKIKELPTLEEKIINKVISVCRQAHIGESGNKLIW